MSLAINRLAGYFARLEGLQRQGCLVSSPHQGSFVAEATGMIRPPDPRYPLGTFRPALVARVRREIQLGIYETPEKLEIAVERMLASLDGFTFDDDDPHAGPC
jgi:hypothetical protein